LALQKPDAFYSNDKVFVPFIDVAKNLKYDWVWGPTHSRPGAVERQPTLMPCFFSLAKVDSWVSANALVMGRMNPHW
jgi:hypothetical protein